MSFETGRTSISGNVDVTVANAGGTPTGTVKVLSAYTNGASASGTLGTVGAGKTWYILGYCITGTTGQATSLGGSLLVDGTPIGAIRVKANESNTSQVMFPQGYAYPVAATKAVTWAQDTNCEIYFIVYYIEV